MNFILDCHFIKFNSIKLLEKIKFNSDKEFKYFRPEDQLICGFNEKFNKVYEFIKYKSFKVNIKRDELEKIYNFNDQSFEFNGRKLLNEEEYLSRYRTLNQQTKELYLNHQESCSKCNYQNNPKKKIKKRRKLNDEDKCQLSYLIGRGFSYRKIKSEMDLSTESIRKFKLKLKNKDCKRKFKPGFNSSSLTKLEQDKIKKLVELNPFDKPADIKRKLKLKCSKFAIRYFLSKNNLNSYVAQNGVLNVPNHLNLRKRFATSVKDLTSSHWDLVVFSDEKTLQNFHNGRIRVIRRRGKGRSPKYIYRRTLQRFKINLFGYITRFGVGDLFVFSDKTNSELFINYLNNDIIPSIIDKVGDQFIYQQDNVGFHVSKISLEYFKRAGVNLLLWPPGSPDWNIIKNVWSYFQKKVNAIIFKDGLPTSKAQLIEYAYKAWYSIPPSFIRKLYESLPGRFRKFLNEISNDDSLDSSIYESANEENRFN